MDIGFDEILHSPVVSTDNIGASPNGQHIVSSSFYTDTFSEHPDRTDKKPVKIINGASDTIGFFGRDIYMVAIASGNILRILDYKKSQVLLTTMIRPGSLYVPSSANSQFIGAVSPQGKAVIIDDDARIVITSLEVPEGYTTLWTSTARPVGFIWVDKHNGKANLLIKSDERSKSILSSSHDISVYSVWANPHTRKHEAYFQSSNKPHILQKVVSAEKKAEIDTLAEFPEGAEVTGLICLPNGQPAIATANYKSRVITEKIEPATKVSEMLDEVLTDEYKNTTPKLIGNSLYVSWTQTPVTRPVPAVTLYGREGRPRYEIKGNCIDEKPLRPKTNKVFDYQVSKDYTLSYRVVSPFPIEGYTAKKMVVFIDEFGSDASGKFSPTVRMLYDMGIPVAIVPFFNHGEKERKIDLAKLIPDVVDVSRHAVKNRIATETIVVANDGMCESALTAMTKYGNSKISKCVLINPHNSVAALLRGRKARSRVVSAYFGVDEKDIVNPGKYTVFNDLLTPEEATKEVRYFMEEQFN